MNSLDTPSSTAHYTPIVATGWRLHNPHTPKKFFFIFEVTYISNIVVPLFAKTKQCVFWGFLCVECESWCGRRDKRNFRNVWSLPLPQMVLFFMHQLNVRIQLKGNESLHWNFGDNWLNVVRLCCAKAADSQWHMNVP